jgi:hypothetical protein
LNGSFRDGQSTFGCSGTAELVICWVSARWVRWWTALGAEMPAWEKIAVVAPRRRRRDRSHLYKQHAPDRPRALARPRGDRGHGSTGRAALQRAGGRHGLSGDEAARARAKRGSAARRAGQDHARPSMGRFGDGQPGRQRAARNARRPRANSAICRPGHRPSKASAFRCGLWSAQRLRSAAAGRARKRPAAVSCNVRLGWEPRKLLDDGRGSRTRPPDPVNQHGTGRGGSLNHKHQGPPDGCRQLVSLSRGLGAGNGGLSRRPAMHASMRVGK